MRRATIVGATFLMVAVLAGSALAAPAGPEGRAGTVHRAIVDPRLERQMTAAGSGEMVNAVVVLDAQADLTAVQATGRKQRLAAVERVLRAKASATQGGVLGALQAAAAKGLVADVTPLWIFNGIGVRATPDVIDQLAARPDVAEIQADTTIAAPAATGTVDAATPEPNISLVNAPALWDLGFRGQGIVVANMDTGVDVSHPELASRWRGGTNSWFDPYGQHPTTPTDVSGHGTWTMGAMVGADAGGTSIGVAPDARWIAVKIFRDNGTATSTAIHQGFQWLLDPDHNPATADAPNVVNNSWTSTTGCNLDFQLDLQALRAAGILPVFAAGNFGPSANTSAAPANNPEAFAVGGTNDADVIDSSSSRGPSACGQALFPELTAPGVSVRTTDLFGLYANETGTSMAAPHVAGALALLLQAFPGISADRQEAALEAGAVDLGAAGPDNVYGYGRLDVLAAYSWLGASPDFAVAVSPSSASALPGASASFTATVTGANGFVGDVSLSLSGLSASQATWAFTPDVVTGGSGTADLTVTTASTLPPGSYPITITGTSGSLVRSAQATIVVDPPPDFSIASSPGSASTIPGGGASFTVTIAGSGGFSGDVSLSLSGLSTSDAVWTFTPAVVTGGSGTAQLDVTTSSTLAPGTYQLTITGTSGSLVHATSSTLVVNTPPPPPDFTVDASPSAVSTPQGGAASSTVSVSGLNGFNGSVSLSLTDLPASLGTSGFSPAVVSGGTGTSQLTVTTSGSATPGTYPLTVVATDGSIVHTTSLTLTVTAATADFTLSVSPATATIHRGGAGAYVITVSKVGSFAGSVSLSVSGVPSRATASFSRTTVVPPGTSTLTVRPGSRTPVGTYTLTIKGKSGKVVHQVTAMLVVT